MTDTMDGLRVARSMKPDDRGVRAFEVLGNRTAATVYVQLRSAIDRAVADGEWAASPEQEQWVIDTYSAKLARECAWGMGVR